jgi:hydrogenase maturation protease
VNLAPVDSIANAVLYEGYLLYPYRASSVKNRQRWTFGGLYPRSYSQTQRGSDAWSMQTECLVEGACNTVLEVKLRFLHLVAREVGELAEPLPELPPAGDPPFRVVEALTVGSQVFRTWQEAVERAIDAGERQLDELTRSAVQISFAFPAQRDVQPLRNPTGQVVGLIARLQQPIEGLLELAAEQLGERLFKIRARIMNLTAFEPASGTSRDPALLRSLVSTHTILGVSGGAFVSLLDPPEQFQPMAAACSNVGTWPVLVGEEGQRDTMLSSPIILYDYPQTAPESPGDLFDSTEIDEILTLRILTMTDEEKREMCQLDERARALLARTEALGMEGLSRLHGSIRTLRPLGGLEPLGSGLAAHQPSEAFGDPRLPGEAPR